MANYTTTAVIHSATITLNDIPFDAYRAILDYINKTLDPLNPIDLDECRKIAESTDKWSGISKDSKAIADYLKRAEENPDSYTWAILRANEWADKVPEIKQQYANNHSLTMRLMGMSRKGLVERHEMLDKQSGLVRPWFKLPVPKLSAPVTVDPEPEPDPVIPYSAKDAEIGHKLRAARNKCGLSIGELSKAIGYGADVIQKWEIGVFSMGEPAKNAVCKFFAKDIFATA